MEQRRVLGFGRRRPVPEAIAQVGSSVLIPLGIATFALSFLLLGIISAWRSLTMEQRRVETFERERPHLEPVREFRRERMERERYEPTAPIKEMYWTESGPVGVTDGFSHERMMESELSARATVADPVPLGLTAFALTFFLLGAINAFFGNPVGSFGLLLPIAIAFGGITQFVAAMWAFRKGNTFAATVLGSFGGFWLTFSAMQLFAPTGGIPLGVLSVVWAIFGFVALYSFASAFGRNLAMILVFGLLTAMFWTGTLAFALDSIGWLRASGWLGMVSALVAYYVAFATVVNSTMHREALPLGIPRH